MSLSNVLRSNYNLFFARIPLVKYDCTSLVTPLLIKKQTLCEENQK